MPFLASPDPSLLTITRAAELKPLPALDPSLVFGDKFSDHMLTIQWTETEGWGAPEVRPYAPFPMDPAAMVLHHALCLFEGMKAYRAADGGVRVFRPDMNMRRMNKSAAALQFPAFDPDVMAELIRKFIAVDERWVPSKEGFSLYVRPTMIANNPALGGRSPSSVLFFVILSPVGPYHASGSKAVSLLAMSERARAWPGGSGSVKVGANYAPGYKHQADAAKRGHQAILWLFGPEHALTEVGMMNLFVVFKHPDGTTELETCPLTDMILPGITRDSILTLTREHASGATQISGLPANLIVNERIIYMKEVVEAARDGTLVEVFGSGTAAVVAAVNRIEYEGQLIAVPVEESGEGAVCAAMHREIVGRQRGEIPSEWCIKVC